MANKDDQHGIKFAESLFEYLMTKHPELKIYRRFVQSNEQNSLLSGDFGKCVMYTWHMIRNIVEKRLAIDFPQFSENETVFKKYLLNLSDFARDSCEFDSTRALLLSAILLETLLFLNRKGITRFLIDAPHFWNLMFEHISEDFYEFEGWRNLVYTARREIESHAIVTKSGDVYKRYFMDIDQQDIPANSNGSDRHTDLSQILSCTQDCNQVSVAFDVESSASVSTKMITFRKAIKTLPESTMESQSSEDAACIPVKLPKSNVKETVTEAMSKIGKPSPASCLKVDSTSNETPKSSKSPLDRKKSGETTSNSAIKSPVSPTKTSAKITRQQREPVAAESAQVKIFTKKDAFQKHLERMGQLRQSKQSSKCPPQQATKPKKRHIPDQGKNEATYAPVKE